MEKLFENKTTYDKDIYIKFLNFHNEKFKFSYMAYTVFWSLLFALCIYLAFSSGNRLQGVIVTIVLIAFVGYRIYRPQMIVNKEMKSDKVSNNNTNTFTFYDKNLKVTNDKRFF